jgi:hypothetical protein
LAWTLLTFAAASPVPAQARTVEECQLKWGQAARSYVAVVASPPSPDDAAFKPACELEAKGDKDGARLEALTAAAAALFKQDKDACERFIKFFAGVAESENVCLAASDTEALKKTLAAALKPKQ